MVERVRRSKSVDEVVVATTTAPGDHAIADFCAQAGISAFRGSQEDVLLRVLEAARWAQADLIVELTGDCPLIDPAHIDAMVDLYREQGLDYVNNRLKPGYPDGLDVQVFSTSALAEVATLTQDPIDRTHVSCYFYHNPQKYRLGGARLTENDEEYWPDLGITLDEEGDYQLLSRIFEALIPVNPSFSAVDVLRLLRKNPGWLALNRHVRRKELNEG
jgi:spore coat polysaccharide biosynthesis protein SpsF